MLSRSEDSPAQRLVVCFTRFAPATGLDLLRTMHDAYQGKWYRSLTFTQQTTRRRPDGSDTVSTWYESVLQSEAKGTQLRIDIGDPAAGNGTLYTADSTIVLRGGKIVAARAGGNALVPVPITRRKAPPATAG